MSKDNDGKSLKASGLTLDTKTKLLDFERQSIQLSLRKSHGHNRRVVINGMTTTFKAGSYGSEKGADPQPNTR